MGTASWFHAAARPCRHLSLCTRRPRASFSMAVTAEAAAQGEEKEEAAKAAGEVFMKTSARSWTIKSGLVTLPKFIN